VITYKKLGFFDLVSGTYELTHNFGSYAQLLVLLIYYINYSYQTLKKFIQITTIKVFDFKI